jgi:hypothetical protein
MVLAEVGKLNQNKTERQAMINRVYQTAMGRDADQTSLAYWLPRSEHYRLMIQANRNWLYSANGVNDLLGTVTRALEFNLKRKPTDAEIKKAMVDYTPDKKIYAEMTQKIMFIKLK